MTTNTKRQRIWEEWEYLKNRTYPRSERAARLIEMVSDYTVGCGYRSTGFRLEHDKGRKYVVVSTTGDRLHTGTPLDCARFVMGAMPAASIV